MDFTTIDMDRLSKREAYRWLSNTVVPRPIAYVTTKGERGVLNGAPFSFFNIVSTEPPLIMLSIGLKEGRPKDSTRNILRHKNFVVHMVDEKMIERVNESSKSLKPDESEVEMVGFTPIKSDVIETNGILESPLRFECKLYQTVTLSSKEAPLIIGEVIRMHVANDVVQPDHTIDLSAYKPIARLGGSLYVKQGEIFSLKRPK